MIDSQEKGIQIVRCQRTIGAEIVGVNLSKPLTDVEFRTIYEALLECKVVFFRNQTLTTEAFLNFGGRFGALEENPFRPQGERTPELQIIKNDKNNPVLSTDVWHADLTFRKYPTKFTVLRCIAMPTLGGDTMWSDMCAAYDGLSEPIRNFVIQLRALHDFKNFRVLYGDQPEKRAELHRMEDTFPKTSHPVVITHPETNQRVLFVNRQFTLRIQDLTNRESEKLLELLYEQSQVPEYQFRLKWLPDTIAVWDNRLCQHYAVNDYYPDFRHMERVAVAGNREPTFHSDAKPDENLLSISRVHAFE